MLGAGHTLHALNHAERGHVRGAGHLWVLLLGKHGGHVVLDRLQLHLQVLDLGVLLVLYLFVLFIHPLDQDALLVHYFLALLGDLGTCIALFVFPAHALHAELSQCLRH